MARRKLTDRMIAALPRTGKRRVMADPELARHYLRIPAGPGPIAYTVILKRNGRQQWAAIGDSSHMDIETARAAARIAISRLKAGKPAVEPPLPPPQSTAAVAQAWLTRHVDKNKLRTAREYHRIVRAYIARNPIGAADFASLRRSDITAFLDQIEDRHSAEVADHALAVLRSIASWVQSRSDDYVPPFTRGMHRVPIQKHQRSRILSDDELRRVWLAAEEAGTFGAIVQLLLLTCQRRAKICGLRWQDIDAAGVWTIATEEGEKGNTGRLPLSKLALTTINAQPRFASSPFVFPTRKPSNRAGAAFKKRCGVDDLRLHDLRRQGRSLLSRIGVIHEVAEAILGHRPANVVRVYQRYSFESEKGIALEKLADAIQQIVRPPPANVTPLHKVAS